MPATTGLAGAGLVDFFLVSAAVVDGLFFVPPAETAGFFPFLEAAGLAAKGDFFGAPVLLWAPLFPAEPLLVSAFVTTGVPVLVAAPVFEVFAGTPVLDALAGPVLDVFADVFAGAPVFEAPAGVPLFEAADGVAVFEVPVPALFTVLPVCGAITTLVAGLVAGELFEEAAGAGVPGLVLTGPVDFPGAGVAALFGCS